MRISTTQIYQQGIAAFGDQQSKLAKLQQQISTGVRITKPSDDPLASTQILGLEQVLAQHDQYQRNIVLADSRLVLEDSTLNAVENEIFRIRELAIQGNNDTLDDIARQAIASEIDSRIEAVISLANTRDANGDFIFAGFQTQIKPFEQGYTGSIEHVQFVGDQHQRLLQVSEDRQIEVGDSGSDIFVQLQSPFALNEIAGAGNASTAQIAPAHVNDGSVFVSGDYQIVFTAANTYDVVDLSGPVNIVTGASYTDSADINFQGIQTSITGTPAIGDTFTISQGQYRDMFSIFGDLSEALTESANSTQRNANIAQALDDLNTALSSVLETRTKIGGRLNSLDFQRDNNEAFIVLTKQTLSTIRDTDLAEAISQLTLEQTTLDAAQAIFARITSSSLFNFLR